MKINKKEHVMKVAYSSEPILHLPQLITLEVIVSHFGLRRALVLLSMTDLSVRKFKIILQL